MLRALGPYRVLNKLGEGGMAEIFLAEREREGGFRRRVALKRIHPRFKRNEVLLERFLTEARTHARLAHANVVKILDFGVDPEPFLALEFVDGISIGQLMHRMYEMRQRLDPSAAMFIATGAAKALDHAHRLRDEDGTPLGIVHRDLTPANVLLSADGTPYVTDFGLVQVADNLLETYGAVPVGTFCYMAPEQLEGGHVDARADLFSLGILLWEMLTTRNLLPSNDPKEVRKIYAEREPPPPSKLNPEVPADLDALTMQLLAVDPEKRPPSAEAVSVALQRMAHERAPGYGSEQLAKTLRWAFPEREWDRDPAALPPAQPSIQERAKLATRTPGAPKLRWRAAKEWVKTNGLPAIVMGILLFFTAVISFVAGALWMAFG